MTQAAMQSSIWGTVNGQPLRIPVIGVAGEHGSGKSTWIATIDPMRTCMIDAEESSVSYNLPFAKRYNLYEELGAKTQGRAFRPIQAFEWFKALVEGEIQAGQFTVVGLDPASDIEHGMVEWVKDHHAEFGLSRNQVENAGGLLWGAVNEYWKAFIGILSSKVQTFAYTVHMGSVWKGGKPVEGKRKAKGKSSLKEVTSLFMTLDRSAQLNAENQLEVPAAPTAYTVDPLGKARLHHTQVDPQTGEVLGIQPILPPRIVNCTPRKIREYIAQPPDWENLKPEEQLVERKLTETEQREREDERQQTELEIETARLTRAQLLANAGKAAAQQIAQESSAGNTPPQPARSSATPAPATVPSAGQPQAQATPAPAAPSQQPAAPPQQQAPTPQQPPQQQPQPDQAAQQAAAQQAAAQKQQEQERIAAEAKAAMANPMAAGKEVGPQAAQEEAPPAQAPPQQQPAQQPAPEPAPQQPAPAPASAMDRAAVTKECLALFKKLNFDSKSALAKIREYEPTAKTFADLTDENFAKLYGFLSDAAAIAEGPQGN